MSVQSGAAGSRRVTGVLQTGRHQLTARLSTAPYWPHARHALTRGLVGAAEDAHGGVGRAPSVVLVAGVFGDTDPAVALEVGFAGARDLWPLRRALCVHVAVPSGAHGGTPALGRPPVPGQTLAHSTVPVSFAVGVLRAGKTAAAYSVAAFA